MNLQLELTHRIEERFASQLIGSVEKRLDALLIILNNGVELEARIAAPNAYVITWTWEGRLLRIDTAPIHKELATFPNHLHDADGQLQHDPLTRCGGAPWDNLAAVIDAVLTDPLLTKLTSPHGTFR